MFLILKFLQKDLFLSHWETFTFVSSIQNFLLFSILLIFTRDDEHTIGCEIRFCFLKGEKYSYKRKVEKEDKHDVLTNVLRLIDIKKE